MMKNEPSRDKLFQSAVNKAAKYLSRSPKSTYQVQRYLGEKQIEPDIIVQVIADFKEKKFLDDAQFARMFIENRSKYKPKSRFALRQELRRKGIDRATIETALSGYDNEALAFSAVKSRLGQWQNLDTEKFKKKLMNFLRYRGFDYHTCISALNHFLEFRKKFSP